MSEENFKNIGDIIIKRGTDAATKDKVFLQFEEEKITFGEYLTMASRYANMFLRIYEKKKLENFNIGVFMQNYPEYPIIFGACALCGATLSGINTGQKGESLIRDLNFTDCMLLVTDRVYMDEVAKIIDDLEFIRAEDVLVNTIREEDKVLPKGFIGLGDKLMETEMAIGIRAFNNPPDVEVDPSTNQMIIFTSGITGAPKGIVNSHQKLLGMSSMLKAVINFSSDDVAYGVMPHFHSNSTFISLMPALLCAGGFAFRRKFSASGFLPDIKKFGCSTFNYVGKPLAYVLAATVGMKDHDNRLRIALGNGASAIEQKQFMERFGLDWVMEVFGSTEGGATVIRMPGDMEGSVGVMPPDIILLRDDGSETDPAEFDSDGLIINYEKAVGEIINTGGVGSFESYYKNPEATNAKIKDGNFHTGDLAYYCLGDKDGEQVKFMFFAGRKGDWIRKDGENFLSEPIEEIVNRYPPVFLCSAYGAPCHQADELVMVSLKLNDGEKFEPKDFYDFMISQEDMNDKWHPDYVRILENLPQTETVKINQRVLKKEFFNKEIVDDPVYWRERNDTTFKLLDNESYKNLKQKFIDSGRANELVRG